MVLVYLDRIKQTMKYESMSDFEINKAVAKLDSRFKSCIDVEFFMSDSIKGAVDVVSQGLLICTVDYCSDILYSWSIIIENQIAMLPPISNGTSGWKAERFHSENCGSIIDCIDKNPLRAAMIVFLEMNKG